MTGPGARLAECTVVGLATRDLRAAALLTELGFNLCDDGLRTIAEACVAHGLALDDVLERLDEVDLPLGETERLGAPWWALDELSALIVRRHHGYLRGAMPAISAWLTQLAERKKADNAFLPEVRDTFAELVAALTSHLAKEEAILFPAFALLAEARRQHLPRPPLPFPTLLHPIRMMEGEHERIDHLMSRLRQLTGNFAPGVDACSTWRLCYSELARFERELCTHMHFENDLLFPRAMELERQLS